MGKMRVTRRRPWRRLAVLRAGRRRHAELLTKAAEAQDTLPPLVCPDDDREFVSVWLPREPPGEPAA
jgi:hypothetical protein